ncbi:SpZ12-1 [Loa loa]|uniref:SpZ12-1 n=1 Tax=Loa loa TaxID=7209 RepID=A0A1S0UD46_LOALO|nr:SpZ12-1 [Loa loa]EJD73346.1 SpZ12-1 [Loa loa]
MRSRSNAIYAKKNSLEKGDLVVHMRAHIDARPFSCLHCNMRFNRKDVMRAHMKIHLLNRPTFNCTVCDKVYLLESTLKSHLKNHVMN